MIHPDNRGFVTQTGQAQAMGPVVGLYMVQQPAPGVNPLDRDIPAASASYLYSPPFNEWIDERGPASENATACHRKQRGDITRSVGSHISRFGGERHG